MTSEAENGPSSIEFPWFEPLADSADDCVLLDRRETSRFMIPRNSGAWLAADEYTGPIGGTLVTRFVRMPISMLHWNMVSLMLNGAISYARLWWMDWLAIRLAWSIACSEAYVAEAFESPSGCAVHSQSGCTYVSGYSSG